MHRVPPLLRDHPFFQIWDLSDPNGQGYLDKPGFYVAMKLVALAQMGSDLSVNNILLDTTNAPKLGDLPKVTVSAVQLVPPNAPVDWTIKLTDRLQYEELFESLHPENNVLLGNKVKGVLMDSKLPVDILGRIWELADQDKDGNLDRPEFVVAMHLVYQALAKKAIPAVLPPELKTELNGNPNNSTATGDDGGFVANFPTDIAPPPVPPLPGRRRREQSLRAVTLTLSVCRSSSRPHLIAGSAFGPTIACGPDEQHALGGARRSYSAVEQGLGGDHHRKAQVRRNF